MNMRVSKLQGEIARLRHKLVCTKDMDEETRRSTIKKIQELKKQWRPLEVKKAPKYANELPFEVIQKRQEAEYKRDLKNIESEIYGYDC